MTARAALAVVNVPALAPDLLRRGDLAAHLSDLIADGAFALLRPEPGYFRADRFRGCAYEEFGDLEAALRIEGLTGPATLSALRRLDDFVGARRSADRRLAVVSDHGVPGPRDGGFGVLVTSWALEGVAAQATLDCRDVPALLERGAGGS